MIKLKFNSTFKMNPPKINMILGGGDHELIPEEELYFDNTKMTNLLIELDITPIQFVNNQFKNVLKIINYGHIVPYEYLMRHNYDHNSTLLFIISVPSNL